MRERAGLCEHPFGTLKRWLGWGHFLVRGFEKVRGEMALLVNCYNLRRVLNILGVADFIAFCQARQRAREQAEAALAAFLRMLTALRTRRRVLMAPARTRRGIFLACPGAACPGRLGRPAAPAGPRGRLGWAEKILSRSLERGSRG